MGNTLTRMDAIAEAKQSYGGHTNSDPAHQNRKERGGFVDFVGDTVLVRGEMGVEFVDYDVGAIDEAAHEDGEPKQNGKKPRSSLGGSVFVVIDIIRKIEKERLKHRVTGGNEL